MPFISQQHNSFHTIGSIISARNIKVIGKWIDKKAKIEKLDKKGTYNTNRVPKTNTSFVVKSAYDCIT